MKELSRIPWRPLKSSSSSPPPQVVARRGAVHGHHDHSMGVDIPDSNLRLVLDMKENEATAVDFKLLSDNKRQLYSAPLRPPLPSVGPPLPLPVGNGNNFRVGFIRASDLQNALLNKHPALSVPSTSVTPSLAPVYSPSSFTPLLKYSQPLDSMPLVLSNNDQSVNNVNKNHFTREESIDASGSNKLTETESASLSVAASKTNPASNSLKSSNQSRPSPVKNARKKNSKQLVTEASTTSTTTVASTSVSSHDNLQQQQRQEEDEEVHFVEQQKQDPADVSDEVNDDVQQIVQEQQQQIKEDQNLDQQQQIKEEQVKGQQVKGQVKEQVKEEVKQEQIKGQQQRKEEVQQQMQQKRQNKKTGQIKGQQQQTSARLRKEEEDDDDKDVSSLFSDEDDDDDEEKNNNDIGFDLRRNNNKEKEKSKSSSFQSSSSCSVNKTSLSISNPDTLSIKSLAEKLEASSLFSMFPSLEDALQNMMDFMGSGYTLFLPSDESVKRLPRSLIKRLKEDPEQLKNLIENHLSEEKKAMTDASVMNSRARGARLRVSNRQDSLMFVNGVRVTRVNQNGPMGGIVHVIDGLLYPPADKNVMDTLKACNRFDGFVTLAEGTGLSDTLTSGKRLLLFIPL